MHYVANIKQTVEQEVNMYPNMFETELCYAYQYNSPQKGHLFYRLRIVFHGALFGR